MGSTTNDPFNLGRFDTSSHDPHASKLDVSKARRVNLDDFTEGDLIELKILLEEKLPYKALADINLIEAAMMHYRMVNSKYMELSNQEGVAPNQLATLANAVSAALKGLADIQDNRYASEVLKQIEDAFIDVVELMPSEDAKVEFMKSYERIVRTKTGLI